MSILLVEDDYVLRETIRNFVTEVTGVEPGVACDGEEALSLLQTQKYDTMVTDWQMPRVNGKELVDRVRVLYPKMGVVVFSGSFITDAEKYPEVQYLRKPFDTQRLADLLSK